MHCLPIITHVYLLGGGYYIKYRYEKKTLKPSPCRRIRQRGLYLRPPTERVFLAFLTGIVLLWVCKEKKPIRAAVLVHGRFRGAPASALTFDSWCFPSGTKEWVEALRSTLLTLVFRGFFFFRVQKKTGLTHHNPETLLKHWNKKKEGNMPCIPSHRRLGSRLQTGVGPKRTPETTITRRHILKRSHRASRHV